MSIVSANANSVGIVIAVPRTVDQNVFLAFDTAAVMNAGVVLIAGASPIIMLSNFSALEIFAITSANGATISWQQFVRA